MINKIGNWVFGSFFRTIGRLLVFVLLGFIIASVVDFGDIFDNFRITDLFFEKVNASTFQNGYWTTFYNGTGSQLSYDANTGYHYFNTTNFPRYVFFNSAQTQSGSGLSIPKNAKNISFNLRITTAELTGAPNTFSFGIYTDNSSLLFCDITSSANYNNVEMNYGLQYNFVAKCPINNNANRLTVIFVQGYDLPSGQAQAYQIQINPNFTFELNDDENGVQAIIDNQDENTQQQMQQQEQQHEEMMESNTTEAQEEAEGFFGDFSVPDTGGLSGIITAPLNTIRSLLNSTCTNLVLPLPFVNQNLTLPCLYDIYNEHFGAFFSIYQTIILAIVAYRCIRSIYFDIHGFMDPNDDRIEVMDL